MANDTSKEQLARVSRMYRSSRLASRALSLNSNTYNDLCRQHGIETPAERNRRRKP